MVKESRQQRRAAGQKGRSPTPELPAAADPLSPEVFKSMFTRLGLIVLGLWVVGGTIAGFSSSRTTLTIALAVPGILTVGVIGLVVWALRRAKQARGVAGILATVKTDEERKAAIERLGKDFKSGDPAAVFAKAQLELQEDPRKALATLEQLNLSKLMAGVADEARSQRAMIHLMLGEVSPARDLVDGIDLTRHQDSRTKAMLGSVIAEAWARSGQAKRAVSTIELFDPEDELFVQLRPQLYRARAFAYAYANNLKAMRTALKKLARLDVRTLGGFMVGKVHPLLQKESRQLLEQSGQVPRKMQIQRR